MQFSTPAAWWQNCHFSNFPYFCGTRLLLYSRILKIALQQQNRCYLVIWCYLLCSAQACAVRSAFVLHIARLLSVAGSSHIKNRANTFLITTTELQMSFLWTRKGKHTMSHDNTTARQLENMYAVYNSVCDSG